MPLQVWRPQHGQEFMAQVEPVEGVGTWRISVCLTANPDMTVIAEATPVRLLESAQEKADALVRRTFDHRCSIETCGVWHAIGNG